MTTPLKTVADQFKSKDKLVEAVQALATDDLWLPRLASDRGGNRGLKHVSNAKLLRLHEILTTVKKDFGTRAKLIDAIVDVEGRGKDADYKKSLDAHPVPRLFDQYKASAKRAKKA